MLENWAYKVKLVDDCTDSEFSEALANLRVLAKQAQGDVEVRPRTSTRYYVHVGNSVALDCAVPSPPCVHRTVRRSLPSATFCTAWTSPSVMPILKHMRVKRYVYVTLLRYRIVRLTLSCGLDAFVVVGQTLFRGDYGPGGLGHCSFAVADGPQDNEKCKGSQKKSVG